MQESSKNFFDRKFVGAASLIGLIYAAVIAALSSFAGKEVAGVALTALATAIFKQFETLRFRELAETDETHTIVIPKLSILRLLLLCFSFFGAQVLLGMMASTVLVMTKSMPDISRIQDIFELLSNWKVFSVVIGLKLVAFFLVGYLIRRTDRVSLYSELVIAAFIAIALPDLLQIADVAVEDTSLLKILFSSGQSSLWLAVFWLPFVTCSFLGARIARQKSKLLPLAELQSTVQTNGPASGGAAV